MKLNETTARGLLTSLGLDVKKANLKRLEKKLNEVPSLGDTVKTPGDEQEALLYDQVIAALEAGDSVTVVKDGEEGGGEEAQAPAEKPKKDKKSRKKDQKDAGVEVTHSEEEGKEGEDVPAQEDKPKKPKKPKKEGEGPKQPGVIASIVEFLRGASEEAPITKKEILARLSKRFPERDPDRMVKTVGTQVPTHLNRFKKLGVQKGPGGYWIPAGEEE